MVISINRVHTPKIKIIQTSHKMSMSSDASDIVMGRHKKRVVVVAAVAMGGAMLLMIMLQRWILLMAICLHLMVICLFVTIVRAILSCIRKMCYGDEGRRVSDDEPGELAEFYRSMSPERQEEIDNLRNLALLRYLSRFTLTLNEEHLLCCAGGSQTDTALSPSKNNEVDDIDDNFQYIERNGDTEEGNKNFAEEKSDMAQDCNSTAVEYTHISLPLPGCDANGINICSTEEKEDGQGKNKRKLTRNEDDAIDKHTEQVSINNDPNQQQLVAKRSVPIFCAICLSEYKKCDRVCWSSNAECSHIFHEDCILQWLVSLGKKKSMSQLFTQHPTDEKLLRNQFCPCCRQDFISVKPALSGSEESV